jgi:hypothetical protein
MAFARFCFCKNNKRTIDGVKHVTTWTKAVRNAMIRGGAEFHRRKALNQAENNWKGFMG